jgi:putative ABC transport system substrate-binding protein
MTRRGFIKLVGAVATWPFAAQAQKGESIRRIGVLGPLAATDPIEKKRLATFLEGMEQWGWTKGRNLQIEYRANVGGADELRRYAEELVAQKPDAILVTSSAPLEALRRMTRDLPIVFVNVADPVGAGFIKSMSQPGANITGFTPLEFGTSGKWLELLKEIRPTIDRVAVIRELSPGGMGQFSAIQSVAPTLSIKITAIDALGAAEIESAIARFVLGPTDGLIVPAIPSINAHRDLIISLAAKHRLPAVYAFRQNVAAGGLLSYGPDQFEPYRRAAGYIDRILKGDKPANLPVQAPVKCELAINMKTAKALGVTMPPALLSRADEVVE